MICPKCHGEAVITVPGYYPEWVKVVPCDYDGCHNGQVSCCEGPNRSLEQGSTRGEGGDD